MAVTKNGFQVLPILLSTPNVPNGIAVVDTLSKGKTDSSSKKPKLDIFHSAQKSATINEVKHYIYYKQHTNKKANTSESEGNKENDLPAEKTLYVLNLPLGCTEQHLENIFGQCGDIEAIHFQPSSAFMQSATIKSKLTDIPFASRGCHVVFADEQGVKKAMNLKLKEPLSWEMEAQDVESIEEAVEKGGLMGRELWSAVMYTSRKDEEELKERVHGYLKRFDEMQEEKRRALLAKKNQPDEDGFITVTRKRNAGQTEGEQRKKRKKVELVDFYRFQMRETKRQQLADLRAKFERDKVKIEALKASRKFKPF